MGKTLRRDAGEGGERGIPSALTPRWLRALLGWAFACAALLLASAPSQAQQPEAPFRVTSGRFTFIAYPKDELLARTLLELSLRTDTFPGLARPSSDVLIAIAPDAARFREWIGPHAPEWGAAVAFPGLNRIVMQGTGAGSDAGDPRVVLRHELAHLALNEQLPDLPPRWFDEGYASFAAREREREAVLEANLLLVLEGVPSLDSLDARFEAGSSLAQAGYALAHSAVEELASLDEVRGLTLFFAYWRETRTIEGAVRGAYGITVDEFEKRWKSRVRRRYGLIALFADLSIIGVGVLVLFFPVYLIRRNRLKARLMEMRIAEAEAAARAKAAALAQLLGEPLQNDDAGPSDRPAPQ